MRWSMTSPAPGDDNCVVVAIDLNRPPPPGAAAQMALCCIMCVIHERRVGPPSGLAAGAGRLHGPSSHREPRPGVRRPTLVTPLVPVTCVALEAC